MDTNNLWNFTPLFNGDDDPKIEKQLKVVEEKSYEFINKWKNRTDYLEDPKVLKQALDEYENWQRSYGADGDAGYYFSLRSAQDENSPALKAKYNKIQDFGKKIGNDIMFFEMRIAKISPELQKKFLEDEGLKDYRHFLEKIFAEAKYLLSEPEEKILTLTKDTSYRKWVDMLSGFISKEEREITLENGEKAVKTFQELMGLISDKNKEIRDQAAKAVNDILKKVADAAEAEINSVLAYKKTVDGLRQTTRPDATRHLGDDINSEVVDAIVEAVSSKFDIARKYYELKAKMMKTEKLKYHERNVPYGKIDKKYSYEEAVALVLKVFGGIDKKFAAIVGSFAANGQIDVYPRKNKSGGAFCAHYSPKQPTYILLNHTDKMNDVLTLAHESGHGINNELAREKQNALNFGTPTSTAEVASTFFEDFVLGEILKEADDELRLSVMMDKLNGDISTIFRQVALYRFELELHEQFRKKGYLSKEEIGKIFRKHMSAYMGDYVEQSAGSENWWIYWSHIRSFFYVYSYASGLLISKSLQNSVKNSPDFVEKVKEFLSAGLSDSPKNIFGKLGIDIADKDFWNKGLDETERLLKETEELAKKLGKI